MIDIVMRFLMPYLSYVTVTFLTLVLMYVFFHMEKTIWNIVKILKIFTGSITDR